MINAANIDDYMRVLLKKGRKSVRWSASEWSALKKFVWAATADIMSGKNGYRIKEGDTFMGLRHYRKV